MTVDEIISKVNMTYKRVTLTGGEPLVHTDSAELVSKLTEIGCDVNIETNGAVDIVDFLGKVPKSDNLFFTIDYKLPSSGMTDKMIWNNFINLRPCDVIKFVIGSDEDMNLTIDIVKKLKQVYTEMPHIYLGAVYGMYDAQKLVNKADKKEKKKYALTVQNVQRMFEDNILANKMFYVATDAADTNVTDDEAKQIKIQYLELITKGTDKNGRKINMGVSDKAKTYKRIKEMLKEAKKSESFLDYAEANTDSSTSEAIIGKDTKLLDKEAIDAAFSLKKGKMSNVIGGKTGYYIIYCVNDNDEDATYARKEEIINERQTKMFKEKYAEWLSESKVDISNKFWDVFTIS